PAAARPHRRQAARPATLPARSAGADLTGQASAVAGLWSSERRALSAGLVLTITLVAFEALAVSTVMLDVAAEFGRDGEALYGWAFTAFFLGTLIGIVAIGGLVERGLA